MATERLSIMNFIEQLDTKYIEELEQFQAVQAEKKRRSHLTSE
jgi:hypothetical protein